MNVLFIMADQLRWDHLACAGHPYLRTPHLDALAQRGVRFTQAYVNSGVCGSVSGPCRSTLPTRLRRPVW